MHHQHDYTTQYALKPQQVMHNISLHLTNGHERSTKNYGTYWTSIIMLEKGTIDPTFDSIHENLRHLRDE